MNRQTVLDRLNTAAPVIAPSMLKCDFGNLQRELELLEAAGAPALHLDVMDGHFVPNLSYGPMVIEKIRRLTNLPFDAHLMISDPAKYLDEFLDAGCDVVTFHIEAVDDPVPLLQRIRSADAVAGLAVNPGTSVERVLPLLPECDYVLVMSVEPGFGGQKFMPASLDKLRRLKEAAPADLILGIDGGIGPDTISDTSAAGASLFVVGSAIFEAVDYGDAIAELTSLAAASGQNAPLTPGS